LTRALLAGIWVAVAGYLAWRIAMASGEGSRGLLADLIFLPFYLMAGVASVAAARRAAGRLRLAWGLAASAWLLSWVGELLYLAARFAPAWKGPMELAGDLTDGAYYPLLAAALLAFAAPPRGLAVSARVAVDAVVALVAVNALAWYFIYRHLDLAEPLRRHLEAVLGSGLGEALVLFSAAVALTRPRPEANGPPLHALAFGAFVLALGDLVTAQHSFGPVASTSLAGDLLLTAGTALGATGGLLAASAGEPPVLPDWLAVALRAGARVPALTVMAVLLLLAAELGSASGGGPIQGLAGWTAVLAVLMMGRLLLAERELEAEARAREAQEQRLHHAQRLELLGQLTGAVAHDFANLLTGLAGTAEAMRDRLPPGDGELAEVDDTVNRGRALCQQLLTMGRRDPPRSVRVDLRAVVDGVLPLLRRLVPAGIQLMVTGDAGRHRVLADSTQLEVALLNLVVNARDAMPDGGSLWIRVDDLLVTPGSGWIQSGLLPGRHVRLTVADTGAGMDEATRRRATERFFTTKAVGKGTGLGLATVQGIATAFGGRLIINSAPGRGTLVALLLPPAR
jgi:signal transduction histidine kinase